MFSMSFSNLGLSPLVCSPLARMGYTDPTPVQARAIPLVLAGTDVVARAQTGTGKTAAFGLPIIDRLFVRPASPTASPRHGRDRSQTRRPRVLVLVPTRELALQVQVALAKYSAPLHLVVTAIVGGVGMGAQIQALRRGTDIVVATPGRLIDHLQRRTADLSSIEILTLDEADRMLDMGFLPSLRQVMAALPRDRQTLLFSATLGPDVARLVTELTRNPAHVDISSDGQVVAATVTHQVHPVALDRKRDLLTHVLKQGPARQALVFCKTKRGSDRVGDHLVRSGIRAAVIHGNKSQGARTRALGDFKAGRVSVLVATDIAARGLDIVQLPLVVNFDLPLVATDYVHRIGRTGRAGHAGHAISLVSAVDRDLLRAIQKLLPAPIEHVVVDGFEGVPGTRPTPHSTRPHHSQHHRAQRTPAPRQGRNHRRSSESVAV
jgi:ATP-dependent RNA helicase RhlE